MKQYAFIWSSMKQDGEEVIYLTKPKKNRYGPSLDKYIRKGKKRRYTTYAKAASYYSIPYYSMVRIAKEARACWKIRKTVIVDLVNILMLESHRSNASEPPRNLNLESHPNHNI